MPIRFRCPGCEGLLSIATRKAGSEIACPKCDEMLIVPPPSESDDLGEPDPTPPPSSVRRLRVEAPPEPAAKKKNAAPASPPLFEESDFDRLLGDKLPAALPAESPRPAKPADAPAVPKVEEGILVSRGTAILLAALTAVLLGLAFAAGYMARGS